MAPEPESESTPGPEAATRPPEPETHRDPAVAKARRAGLLALANLTGLGLGYLPLRKWTACLVLTGITAGLGAWFIATEGFWLPLVLWIVITLGSALVVVSVAGVPEYTERSRVPAWEPLALLAAPVLVAVAASPLANGPNREVDERVTAAVEAGDCQAARAAIADRSWWMSLLGPSSIEFDGDAETACERLDLAMDADADASARLEALGAHLDGDPAWQGGQPLLAELTTLASAEEIAAAINEGDGESIRQALAKAEERFGRLETTDGVGTGFATTLLETAEQPCGLLDATDELAATESPALREAYAALDDGLASALLDCAETHMAAMDHSGAGTRINEWREANPESVQQGYADKVLGFIDLRTLLTDWPNSLGTVNEYCAAPVANPLLDPATAKGVVLLSAETLSDPVDAANLAETAGTAKAVLCADVQYESGIDCTYTFAEEEVGIEVRHPVFRWDLWDLASGERLDGDSTAMGEGCPVFLEFEVDPTTGVPPAQVDVEIDEDAARSTLNDALADNL